ncbi:MAG: hypothetical protein KAJ62_14110 [Desulfobacteraceae bacterium]|nr:hypothetical protein [Desulfobacteraceae bacterium]
MNNKQKEIEEGGYSFPIMTLWMVYAGLMITIPYIPIIWVRIALHFVYLLLISIFLRTAFSYTNFEKSKKTDKALSFGTWKLNYLLFFVLIPFGVWIGLMTMRGWRF